jgi:hypothetical protein
MKPKRATAVQLLVFLNPDRTDMGHLATYLFGFEDVDNRKKVSRLLQVLRDKGWSISKRDLELDELQHLIVQDAYRKHGDKIKSHMLTVSQLATMAMR